MYCLSLQAETLSTSKTVLGTLGSVCNQETGAIGAGASCATGAAWAIGADSFADSCAVFDGSTGFACPEYVAWAWFEIATGACSELLRLG